MKARFCEKSPTFQRFLYSFVLSLADFMFYALLQKGSKILKKQSFKELKTVLKFSISIVYRPRNRLI